MEPIFNTDEEKIEEMVNKKVIEANKAAEEYKKKYEEAEKKRSVNTDSGKISDAVDKIKKQTVVQKEEDIEDCPQCHKHKIKITGLTARCVGPHCGNEYVIVPKNADHKCTNCGIPIKKSDELKACPFCSNESAKFFDWDKLRQYNH